MTNSHPRTTISRLLAPAILAAALLAPAAAGQSSLPGLPSKGAPAPADDAGVPDGDTLADLSLRFSGPAWPGGEATLAIVLDIEPGWHVYWRNPGQTGLATSFDVRVPESFEEHVELGELRWPVPDRYELPSGGVDFVHEDRPVWLLPLTVSPDAPPGEVEITVSADWLICKDLCVPGSGRASATLTIHPGPVDARTSPDHVEFFRAARAALPDEPAHFGALGVESMWHGGELLIRAERARSLTWFPYPLPYPAAPVNLARDGHADRWSLRVEHREGCRDLESVTGVLVVDRPEGSRAAIVTLPGPGPVPSTPD